MPVNGIPKHLVKTLTRAKFEQLADRLIQATIPPCEQALKDAGLTAKDIDEVILVGGSTVSLPSSRLWRNSSAKHLQRVSIPTKS